MADFSEKHANWQVHLTRYCVYFGILDNFTHDTRVKGAFMTCVTYAVHIHFLLKERSENIRKMREEQDREYNESQLADQKVLKT